MSRTIGPALYADLVEVASKEGFANWLSMVRATGGCANPIHLWGESRTLDLSTGEVLRQREPGGLLVACRNRRASRCRSCSETYRADTYQLIRAGLVGGKTVPESVRSHPRVFATLTAPSFGPVHNCIQAESSGYSSCHPHGAVRCGARHQPNDSLLGQPLDAGSYDYANAVIWNALATRLWARTVQLANRRAARSLRISQRDWPGSGRVSVAKVAEFQARGLVHFHGIFRLDGAQPADDPPVGATAAILTDAIRFAAGSAQVVPPLSGFLPVVWGEQLDLRTVDGDDLTDTQVAGYIAKYATKGSGAAGTVNHPIVCRDCAGLGRLPDDRARCCRRCHGTGMRYDLQSLQVNAHAQAMIAKCWSLGGQPELEHLRLRPWAHMLGFRGHFSTKSRRYSTTLTKLRSARSEWRKIRLLQSLDGTEKGALHLVDDDAEVETIATVGHWQYMGRGHTPGQALYARTIAEDIAEERHLARLASLDGWDEPA